MTGVASAGLGRAEVRSGGREASAGWDVKVEESGRDMWDYEVMTIEEFLLRKGRKRRREWKKRMRVLFVDEWVEER